MDICHYWITVIRLGSVKMEQNEFMEAIMYVNGVRRVLPDGLAHMTLLEYLRGAFNSILLISSNAYI